MKDETEVIVGKICELDDDVEKITDKVYTIETIVESNNDLLIAILKQTIENGANAGNGTPVVVNCGCGCAEPCDCECPPVDPPGTEPPVEDPCVSETNVFVHDQTYTFSQYGISSRGVHL